MSHSNNAPRPRLHTLLPSLSAIVLLSLCSECLTPFALIGNYNGKFDVVYMSSDMPIHGVLETRTSGKRLISIPPLRL